MQVVVAVAHKTLLQELHLLAVQVVRAVEVKVVFQMLLLFNVTVLLGQPTLAVAVVLVQVQTEVKILVLPVVLEL
jgi:hypothetical protein